MCPSTRLLAVCQMYCVYYLSVLCFFSWAVTSTWNILLFLTITKSYLPGKNLLILDCLNAISLIASFSTLVSLKLSYMYMYKITSWKQQIALLCDFLSSVHIYWTPAFEWCLTRAEDRDECLNYWPQGANSLEKELQIEKYTTHPNTSSCDFRFFLKYSFWAKKFCFGGIYLGITMLL